MICFLDCEQKDNGKSSKKVTSPNALMIMRKCLLREFITICSPKSAALEFASPESSQKCGSQFCLLSSYARSSALSCPCFYCVLVAFLLFYLFKPYADKQLFVKCSDAVRCVMLCHKNVAIMNMLLSLTTRTIVHPAY